MISNNWDWNMTNISWFTWCEALSGSYITTLDIIVHTVLIGSSTKMIA